MNGRRMWMTGIGLLALATGARAAPSCVPVASAALSTIPARAISCPAGDAPFDVVVRGGPCPPGTTPIPLAGSVVVLRLATCGPFTHCANRTHSAVYDDAQSTVSMVTNALGRADFRLELGRSAADSCLAVQVDGAVLRRVYFISPDQNGDLRVNDTDISTIVSKFGTADRSADFDGDGIVGPADEAIAREHHGHYCLNDGLVPAVGPLATFAMLVALGWFGALRVRRRTT